MATGSATIGHGWIRRGVPLFAAAAVALLSGCANRDSITVGSVPDDYRTNHPIMIAEKEEVLDLPVGTGDRGATRDQRSALQGFLAGYDVSASPTLWILVPAGSRNELAATEAARDFARIANATGVPKSRISISSYQSQAPEVAAPVRVTFTAVRAQTNKCGRWPEDMTETSENKHYANFGCAYQNNLAAQVANPNDFLGPRKPTEVDAEKRGKVFDNYRKPPLIFSPTIDIDW